MPRLTWLPDVLRGAGLTVDVLPGWSQRGRSDINPQGIVVHHTVTGPSWPDHRVDHLLRDGHANLAGPLSQLGLRRDGSFVVVAAGRCNHNGYGKWGNDAIGIEGYNDGRHERWPDAQMDAYARGCAALLAHLGFGVDRCMGHKETDPGRKTDPTFDMHAFRARVADAMQTPAPTEDEMTPEQAAKLDAIHMLATAAANDAAKAVQIAQSIHDRQVPEDTVRADIVLTREIAKKVGATTTQG